MDTKTPNGQHQTHSKWTPVDTKTPNSGHQNTKWSTPNTFHSHQLITLLGETTDMVEWREKYQTVDTLDTKWKNTGHRHQMVEHWTTWTPNGGKENTKTPNIGRIPRRRSHQTTTRYFVILPFKECFLSNFTSF